MNQKHKVGDYLVIGNDGDWQIMEQFGNYRMLKKKFKKLDKAITKAKEMSLARQMMGF